MRAMILSAGYGTRLWPLTEDRTKPALPILGKPLVGYVAEYLAGYGCREIIVNLHHRPKSVKAALGDGSEFGVTLKYVEEPIILGTSGALDNARTLLGDETFVVVNGKIVTDIDLNAALETHRATGALATLVLLPNVARERFSVVEVADGFVKGFGGMPAPGGKSPEAGAGGRRHEQEADGLGREQAQNEELVEAAPLMFTGIQILEPRIFDYIPRGVFSHSTTDVYPQAIANGERIAAHIGTGRWYELSTINRYLEISLRLLSERGASIHSGKNCNISPAARVESSILWDNVTVESGARVKRAVLGDGVLIAANEVIENAAVVRSVMVREVVPPPKALKGEFHGDNFVVPLTE